VIVLNARYGMFQWLRIEPFGHQPHRRDNCGQLVSTVLRWSLQSTAIQIGVGWASRSQWIRRWREAGLVR